MKIKALFLILFIAATAQAGDVIGDTYFDDYNQKHVILNDREGRFYRAGGEKFRIDNLPEQNCVWTDNGYQFVRGPVYAYNVPLNNYAGPDFGYGSSGCNPRPSICPLMVGLLPYANPIRGRAYFGRVEFWDNQTGQVTVYRGSNAQYFPITGRSYFPARQGSFVPRFSAPTGGNRGSGNRGGGNRGGGRR